MTDPDNVALVVTFGIRDYERWKSVADECVAHVKANEPGTLAYEWYVGPDREAGRLHEVYASAEAFRAHLAGAVFTTIGPTFGSAIEWRAVEVFGDPPAELFTILRGLPIVVWKRPVAGIL